MADSVSSAEIEDVLSSIRRLVSEDTRSLVREKPVVAKPVVSDRLVLTPALRVADVIDPQPEIAEAPPEMPQSDMLPDRSDVMILLRPEDRAEPLEEDANQDLSQGTVEQDDEWEEQSGGDTDDHSDSDAAAPEEHDAEGADADTDLNESFEADYAASKIMVSDFIERARFARSSRTKGEESDAAEDLSDSESLNAEPDSAFEFSAEIVAMDAALAESRDAAREAAESSYAPQEPEDTDPVRDDAETDETDEIDAEDAEDEIDETDDADIDETPPWIDPDTTLFKAAARLSDAENDPVEMQVEASVGEETALDSDPAETGQSELDQDPPEATAQNQAFEFARQDLSAKIEALETAIGETDDQWEPDDTGVDEYGGTRVETLQWEDHTDESTDFDTDPETDTASDMGAGPDQSVDEDDIDLLEQAETILDEESLRELVSDIVREELQGALGERITRNVRKLVRREIHRALTAQELD